MILVSDEMIKDVGREYHMFEDCVEVHLNDKLILIYSDLNMYNSIIADVFVDEASFAPDKYMYIDGTVVLNIDYVEELEELYNLGE